MFKNLPLEIENKILFLAHPQLSKDIKIQIKNYKNKNTYDLRFQHPINPLFFIL